ncbi:putative two-component sensor histidine kinase protein [Rhizobium etli CFN 42]|uniref:histidine kinase n=1 Tax=Rhizobium etli (strain ATCC 51251 / DSM 11541 / JCM 21823 / NBRC 15573 / CFN 42) TaxID=347834 RepID=Q2K9H5_RHIEC|nr:putative two-component sensor histidine kinase protein [Rhizobium etli CFN 42]
MLDIDGLPEFIDADPRSLSQVVTNLLSNAVKYAPGTSEIRVAAWEETGNVKISISDDGVGIDAEDVPRLFQRYVRAHVDRDCGNWYRPQSCEADHRTASRLDRGAKCKRVRIHLHRHSSNQEGR